MSEALQQDEVQEMAPTNLDTGNLPDQPGGGGFRIVPEWMSELGKGYLTGWANVFASGGRGLEATGRAMNRPFVRYPRAKHPYLAQADELLPGAEINSLGIPYVPAGVLGPEPVSLAGNSSPTIRDRDIGGVRIEGMAVADEERKREFFTPDPKLKQAREFNAYLTKAEEMNDPAAYALTKVGQGIAWLGETARDTFPSLQRDPRLVGRDWKELIADSDTRWLYLARIYGESLPQVAAALGVTVGVSAATANPALGVTAGAGFSYALATGESFQAYKDLGASDEEAAETACLVGLVSAAVETVPLGRFMQKTPGFKQIFTTRLQQHLGKKLIQDLTFRSMYKEAFKQGLTEGGTEAIQQVIQNYGKSFFMDNQDLFEGVDEAAFVGFLMGNTYSHAGQMASKVLVVSNDRLALKDRAAAEAAADLERLRTWRKMDAPRPAGASKTRMAKRLEIELSKQMEPEKARTVAEMGAWEMEQRARRWAAHKGRHPEEWWDRFLPQAAMPDEGKVVIRDGDALELAEKSSISSEGIDTTAKVAPGGQVLEIIADEKTGTAKEGAESGIEPLNGKSANPAAETDVTAGNTPGKTILSLEKIVVGESKAEAMNAPSDLLADATAEQRVLVYPRGDGSYAVLEGEKWLQKHKAGGGKEAEVRVAKELLQPDNIGTSQDLLQHAEKAYPELKETSESWARQLGGIVHDRPLGEGQTFPHKDMESLDRKADKETGGKFEKVKDMIATTITFDSEGEVLQALERLKNDPRVVVIKDRYAKPMPNGYRDIFLNVRLSNGHIAEVQLNTQRMYEAKNLEHALYEIKRELQPIVDTTTDPVLKMEFETAIDVISKTSIKFYGMVNETDLPIGTIAHTKEIEFGISWLEKNLTKPELHKYITEDARKGLEKAIQGFLR